MTQVKRAQRKKRKESRFEDLAALGSLINIIGNESRLKILFLLTRGELCVCKIYDSLNLSQSLVSHHLAILREHDLVNTRREGKWVHYSINKEALKNLNQAYLAIFDADTIVTAKQEHDICD